MQDTLLLTIDFINELTHKDGKLAHSEPFIEQNHTIDNALENIARIATVKSSADFQCPNEN